MTIDIRRRREYGVYYLNKIETLVAVIPSVSDSADAWDKWKSVHVSPEPNMMSHLCVVIIMRELHLQLSNVHTSDINGL